MLIRLVLHGVLWLIVTRLHRIQNRTPLFDGTIPEDKLLETFGNRASARYPLRGAPPMTREELLRYFPRTEDPEILAARLQIVNVTLDEYPELDRKVRGKARLEEARRMLRRVLARRELAVSADDDARIEACEELETLERWLEQSITASTATEALR